MRRDEVGFTAYERKAVVNPSLTDMRKTAEIHSFESMAAADGEGIRYGVFFCGCPLHCVYCHNPDTWSENVGDCLAEKHLADVYCAEDVFKKVKRFKLYFKDRGGVTFSGGEPLLHASFINELAVLLKEEGIGYCLDTSGSVMLTDEVKTAIDNADMVILDAKFYDSADYEKYTGGDIENMIRIGEYCSERGVRLWLRTVVVPDINDTEGDMKRYAEFARRFKFEKYELLGFHTMGFFKYEGLGIENPLADTPPMDAERLGDLQRALDTLLAK